MGSFSQAVLELAINHSFALIVALVLAIGAWSVKQSVNQATVKQELHDHKALEAHPNSRQQQIDEIKGDIKVIHEIAKSLRAQQESDAEALKELINARLSAIEQLIVRGAP